MINNGTVVKRKEDVAHEWYVVDVSGAILGRAAAKIAHLLSGKHKTDFTPHTDNGAGVVVLNCDKLRVTGKKGKQKMYARYSGYPGGRKETEYNDMMAKNPKYVIRHAVKGMLPKNKLAVHMLRRMKIYTGTEHPHVAQAPKVVKI